MATRKSVSKGGRLTKRSVIRQAAETADEARAALDDLDRTLADPLARLRHQIAQAGADYANWREAHPGLDRGDETVPDLLLRVKFAGEEMERALAGGDAERAAAIAAGVGELLALLWFEHNWAADAERGRKYVENAPSKLASDEARFAVVEAIRAKRGIGARHAFNIAARNNPEMGKAGTFKASYYKHKKSVQDGR